jgi:hypothetical protein
LEDACATHGRDPAALDRIVLTGAGDERPLASVAAFEDGVAAYRDIGMTDVVVHHPRAGDPYWDDPPDMLERIAPAVAAAQAG